VDAHSSVASGSIIANDHEPAIFRGSACVLARIQTDSARARAARRLPLQVAPMSITGQLLVRRMLDEIDRDYADVVTLRTLGATIGRQPAYLGHVFRTVLGLTVHERMTRVRLERAAEMIKAGTKIEAVSLTVGYRSKKNFYRQFKRYFGTTPAGYRRQCGDDDGAHQPA